MHKKYNRLENLFLFLKSIENVFKQTSLSGPLPFPWSWLTETVKSWSSLSLIKMQIILFLNTRNHFRWPYSICSSFVIDGRPGTYWAVAETPLALCVFKAFFHPTSCLLPLPTTQQSMDAVTLVHRPIKCIREDFLWCVFVWVQDPRGWKGLIVFCGVFNIVITFGVNVCYIWNRTSTLQLFSKLN